MDFDFLRDAPPKIVFKVREDRRCTTITELLDHEEFVLEPANVLPVSALRDVTDRNTADSISLSFLEKTSNSSVCRT